MFTTCIISSLSMVGSLQLSTLRSVSIDDIIAGKSYKESSDMQDLLNEKAMSIMRVLDEYKSKEYIQSAAGISEDEIIEEMHSLYDYGQYSRGNKIIVEKAVYPYSENERDFYDPIVRNAFINANKEAEAAIKAFLIKEDLANFEMRLKEFNAINGFSYYATDGQNVITNVALQQGNAVSSGDFSKQPAYFTYENGEVKKVPESEATGTRSGSDYYLKDQLNSYYNEDLKLYFSFDGRYLAAAATEYNQISKEVISKLPLIIATFLIALITFIWLAVTTGRRDSEGKRKLYSADNIWTEIQLAGIMVALVLGFIAITSWACYDRGYMNLVEIGLVGSVIALIASLGLWFVLSTIRIIKARVFLKNSIICKLGKLLIDLISEVINGKGIMRKAMIVSLAICLLSATVFMAPVVLVAIILLVPIWARRFDELQKGVDEVKSGNLAYKIPTYSDKKTVELSRLAEGINEISEASNIAVQNELKNQRMKTELISNVSHDLKTPLTSMVSYVDLLKKEGLDSENAPEYLDILEQKTERLTKLTEDLFEAAKASSGAMPVNLEKVDLLSILNQSLGEMSKGIEESGLEFIINAPQERYFVMSDGRLLWRVIENLLGNVLKYAQEKSRVYIEIKELKSGKDMNGVRNTAGNMMILEIKNMSRQALNIEPDELMERFKRGDEARTTDGSGLGLAITNDLVRLMNGWFEITIDGDLFKATVMLDKAN
ncbi:MAG: HAMP domain-containing sensor histidine kinase [Eubacteriales bacterium]|nr:HAMP domain-containing sensor histidine kinase [Eubacteriales bacterium]